MAAPTPSGDPIQQLVLEFLRRRSRGEALTPERFAAEHPGAGAELRTRLEEAEQTLVSLADDGGRTLRDDAGGDATLRMEGAAPASDPAEVIDGRYEIVRVLGEGGFGTVYLVKDRLYQGELRALKTILAVHSAKPEFEKRFQNEIRVLRALSHKGIPQIHNDGKTARGDFYYTMAYVEGRTLADVLKAEAPLKPDRIVRLVRQMLDVLEYAHGKGVVHRDLKPANVMLVKAGTQGEQVKILDFGIAKVMQAEGDLEAVHTLNTMGGIGTPHYMSPEQIRGQDVDSRTDMYALGIIIYQMCSGLLPFSGKSDLEIATARLERAPTPLAGTDAPDWMRVLIMRLLERNKEKRPSTKEIHDQFERIAGGQRDLRKSLRWVAAGVLVIALSLAGLLFKNGNGDGGPGGNGGLGGGPPPKPATFAAGVKVFVPKDGGFLRETAVDVAGEAPGRLSVTVNDRTAAVDPEGRFRARLDLPPDVRSTIVVRDAAPPETELARMTVVVDARAPTIRCDPPGSALAGSTDRRLVDSPTIVLAGSVADAAPGEIDPEGAKVGEEKLALAEDGSFSHEAKLGADGDHVVRISATDRAGNVARWSPTFVVDTKAPEVKLDGDASSKTTEARGAIKGRVVDAHPGRILLRKAGEDAETPVTLRDGAFEAQLDLEVGENAWTLVAEDAAGHRSPPLEVRIEREKRSIRVAETTPKDGWTGPPGQTKVALTGEADQPLARLTVNGVAAAVDGGKFSIELELKDGANEVEIVPYDADGIAGAARTITLTREKLAMPAGCSLVAGAGADAHGRALRIRHDKTGIELVLVASGDRAFYLGATEVTRAQYRRIAAKDPDAPDFDVTDDHPVVKVSFADAERFGSQAGLRLPSEDEWLLGARLDSAADYPWGGEWIAGACNAGSVGTAPVGTFAKDRSASGAMDMAGNASEWCTKGARGTESANGPEPALRGGSWSSDAEGCKLGKSKKAPLAGSDYVGFRACLDAKP